MKIKSTMTVLRTERGFEVIRFTDRNDNLCSLQQSSIGDFIPPGSSAIWLGIGDNRMHISLSQVVELQLHLNAWIKTGSFKLKKRKGGTT